MQDAIWFIHLEGETFGPVTTAVLQILLKQNRLQFSDFIWSPGFTRWTRVADIHEFTVLMSGYPTAPFPDLQSLKIPTPSLQKQPPPAPMAAAPEEAVEAAPVVVEPPPAPKKPKIRKGERVAIDAKVSIQGKGDFSVINISENGLLVDASEKTLAVGTDIKIKIESTHFPKVLELNGVVVREAATEKNPGFAIEFVRVNPAVKRIILDYIEAKFTLSRTT